MKKIVLQLILLVLPGVSLLADGLSLPVKVEKCTEREVYRIYNAVGKANALQRKDFIANVSGVISYVNPNQGGQVKKGDILFVIEQDLAQSTKTQAESAYQDALVSLNRSKSLYAKKVISQDSYEKAMLQVDRAKLDLEKAKNTYENMVITAPFNGTLGVIDRVVGEYINAQVGASETLFSIINNTGPKNVSFYLPESLIDKIDTNSDVRIKYGDKIFPGKVTAKSSYISRSNGGFLIRVVIEETNNVPDNAFVNAEFIYDKHKALTLPEQAVSKNSQGDILYFVDGDKVQIINFKLGIRSNGFVEVISDQINLKSVVVVEGLQRLYDGAKVRIVDTDTLPN
jgi:RND family efflux transporter MFP subunit